jgi:hypothetical protein
LDLSDERLGLTSFPVARLPFFFAWTCDISRGVLSYRVLSVDSVEILEYHQGHAYMEFPYPDYPAHFPRRQFELRPLTHDEQRTISAPNAGAMKLSAVRDARPDLVRPQHQLCGEPYVVNEPRQAVCPACQGEMPVYASAGDETMSGTGFVGNNFVQVLFHLCSRCAVVTAYQMTD